MADTYRAVLRDVRISARKARLVADLIRGKEVSQAVDTLKLTNKRAAPLMSKLIKSAMANATERATVDVDRLMIDAVFVDEGSTLKRFLPRAQGRATPIRKRSAHVTVILRER